jgi:hypothetical protein
MRTFDLNEISAKDQENIFGGDDLTEAVFFCAGYTWAVLKAGYKCMGNGMSSWSEYAQNGGTR